MTPEQIAELVKKARKAAWATRDAAESAPADEAEALWGDSDLIEQMASALESLSASVANAEARYDASEARNEFLTGVIEAIEQAAKEAKELPK